MEYFEAMLNEPGLKRKLKDFPYKYVGGGYFRDSRIKKGENADIVHGDEIVKKIIEFIIN